MKKLLTIIFTITGVLVLDLATKHFLFDVDYFNLIPNVLSIATNGGNTGAAWGMFSGKTTLLIVISIVMVIALCIFNATVKNKNIWYCLSFGFVVGGALGNMIDRIRLGYVRDFIYLDFWPSFPVFNLADTFLCIGAVMLAVFILFMSDKKKDKDKKESK